MLGKKVFYFLLSTLTLCLSCFTRAVKVREDPLEAMEMPDLSGQQDLLVKRVQQASPEKMWVSRNWPFHGFFLSNFC